MHILAECIKFILAYKITRTSYHKICGVNIYHYHPALANHFHLGLPGAKSNKETYIARFIAIVMNQFYKGTFNNF